MLYNVTGYDKRNFVKLKVFRYLHTLKRDQYADTIMIARRTGCNVRSLYELLKRWVEWEFIELYVDYDGAKGYRLAGRGRTYLYQAEKWYPAFNKALKEVYILGCPYCCWVSPDKELYLVYYTKEDNKYYIHQVEDPDLQKYRHSILKVVRADTLEEFKSIAVQLLAKDSRAVPV